jgi:hypothetical protein
MHCGFEINGEEAEKLTVDGYEGTFRTVGLYRVCAYLLLADWGACEEDKK